MVDISYPYGYSFSSIETPVGYSHYDSVVLSLLPEKNSAGRRAAMGFLLCIGIICLSALTGLGVEGASIHSQECFFIENYNLLYKPFCGPRVWFASNFEPNCNVSLTCKSRLTPNSTISCMHTVNFVDDAPAVVFYAFSAASQSSIQQRVEPFPGTLLISYEV